MPRKLVYDGSRGWHGWEDRFNSMLRMSNSSLALTNQRNDRIRFEHDVHMTQLQHERRACDRRSGVALQQMRNELKSMMAYRQVYREYSFRNQPETRAVGYMYGQELSAKSMPNIVTDRKPERQDVDKEEDDVRSEFSVDNSEKTKSSDSKTSIKQSSKHRSRQANKERLQEIPNSRNSKVLTGECRSIYALKRFTDEKAQRLIQDWSPENLRKKKVRTLLRQIRLPNLVTREKTTSAIFRDYRSYKETREQEMSEADHVRGRRSYRPVTFQVPRDKPILMPAIEGPTRNKTIA